MAHDACAGTGIVSFPSFHAASARAVYLLMIAATPVIGAHYMIDVIGGVGLAVASILVTKYCVSTAANPTSAAAASRQSPSMSAPTTPSASGCPRRRTPVTTQDGTE